ncbi:hypothetical protein CHGG_03440 [Chaetomium globosum CBS 148.51]|uniref:Reverse transcriptase domain-containing protein n=1 Tax=Chaetomium globosum (strain ATCC 6205 / CBS 148.51 / DSM 1962 / NBRC 6347 / NRRL 1970) TaxID=306901 RepID=Q2H8L4_CHAGB|nr:uncharacterized protein CHGG_03440 [Chaetomium globosum CBS 148.51]EAQ91505.1 hypothetical protein CHGG_03440 [Chaetomium globosum CBS 148.51]
MIPTKAGIPAIIILLLTQVAVTAPIAVDQTHSSQSATAVTATKRDTPAATPEVIATASVVGGILCLMFCFYCYGQWKQRRNELASSYREQSRTPAIAEALETENDVNIAKIAWLSRKDTSKAYGSMVVYVTKGSEARRLLDGRYFHLAGESAYTTVFAPREGPIQCYRCQEIGHKAFACKKPQRCGRCAEQGHHHKTCQSVVLKCVLCRGPHESFSKNCRQSLLNDEGLKDFAVLAISEPYARLIEGSVTTVPMSHHNWTKLIPTTRRETTWPIRSMLWVRSDIEVEQIPVPSADLTAARIRLPDRAVLMVSVYVEGGSDEALEDAMREIDRLIRRFRNGTGTRTDIILAGDFNRHDQLWGGDDVSPRRQGEGDRIINLMDEHSLCSLLPRGTKTWQSGDIESTIDLDRPKTRRDLDVGLGKQHQSSNNEPGWQPKSTTTPSADRRVRIGTTSWPMTLTSGKQRSILQTGSGTMGDKIPLLVRPDGSITEGKAEQAQELLHRLLPTFASENRRRGPTTSTGAREGDARPNRLSFCFRNTSTKHGELGKVLSLISFDVKGAYNGVFKDRLLQRLKARGIPESLVKWIDAFCSKRTATIAVNGFTSGRQELPQAGLPQGSPLSPVLFLFFNADLVQHKIDANGGAIAFVDDYTAWVTGPSAESNRTGIQGLDSKLSSTKPLTGRNGAVRSLKAKRPAIIHFTRNMERFSEQTFSVKGEHIARTAAKGLAAALALKRLKMLSPRTARQLFVATVAPVMDYAANVWMHATHPLAMKKVRTTVRFVSPLQKIARVAEGVRVDRMETIQEYAVPPWVPRLRPTLEADRGKAAEMVNKISGIVIATSSSVKKGIVGMGGLARDTLFNQN